MKSLSLKDRCLYFLILSFGMALGHIPLRIFRLLCVLIAFLVRHLARKDRETIGRNVFRVFGLPQHSHASKIFADQCLSSSIACSMETIRYVFNPHSLNLIGVEDLAQKFARISSGQELVFITSHLGSWELAGHVLTKASHRNFYGLAKPSKNEGFSEFLNLVRRRLGIHVLWTGKSSIVKEMMAVLKAGNILGFVMDQKPQVANSPKVPFLGIETPIVSGPASMTLHFKCPVFVIHVVREGFLTYRVLSHEIPYSHSQSMEELTALFALEIEKAIKTYPEQWCWNYKRWKSA